MGGGGLAAMAAAAALQRMGLRFASLETGRQKREADEENEENGVFTFITIKTWPTRRGNQHGGSVFTFLH
jgi:succinate dehydrogenase/fumarate reductase flavoprotein subunit